MTLIEAREHKPSPYVYMCIPPTPKYGNIDEVVNVITEKLNVTAEQIRRQDRTKHIREARQMVMAYCTLHLKMPLKQVGKYLNHDHTTVIHARNLILQEVKNKSDFGLLYKQVFNL